MNANDPTDDPISDFVDDFLDQARTLMDDGNLAGLTRLYARLSADVQTKHPKHEAAARVAMRAALLRALREPRARVRRGANWQDELAAIWQIVEKDIGASTLFTMPHDPAFQEGYQEFLARLGYGPDPDAPGWWSKTTA